MWLIFAGNKRGRVVKCCQFCFHVINCRAVRVSVKIISAGQFFSAGDDQRPTSPHPLAPVSPLSPFYSAPIQTLFLSHHLKHSPPPPPPPPPALCASISLKAPLPAFWMKKTKKRHHRSPEDWLQQKWDSNKSKFPRRVELLDAFIALNS